MCKFLENRFRLHDTDRSGALEAAEFWELIQSMDLGFTPHEIEGMQQWCDWNQDGSITYAEAVNELADHVITTIEHNGKSVREELDRLESQRQNEKSAESQGVAPSLLSYMKDSFENYDTDKSGALSLQEFWPFIRSIFSYHLTDDDLETLQVNLRSFDTLCKF
jgi:Ca2+-binding EF-hand superfamily protein